MDGMQDGTQQVDEGTAQQPEPQGDQAQQAPAQVEPGDAARARADYETALKCIQSSKSRQLGLRWESWTESILRCLKWSRSVSRELRNLGT